MNYGFEDILQRLKDGLSGQVSALEGTLTGDILQAVAAELARIWSQEMDSVTQRAFVTTAQGSWLDAACGDYGVVRKAGEGDETLRARTLEHIRQQGAGGNAADYAAWAQEVPGVASAFAVELGRGAGTVDVYYFPQQDANEEVQQRLQAHLEERRPVGADVAVIPAQPLTVNADAEVVLAEDAALEEVRATFAAKLTEELARTKLTPEGQTVRINRVIGLLMSCPGVVDAQSVNLNGESRNLAVEQGRYAVLGTVNLLEV